MQLSDKTKKIINVIVKVLTWAVVVFAVFMMIFTVISVSTVGKTDRGLFGYKFYIVRTDSMSLSDKNADLDVHFSAGDLIIVQDVADKTSLQAGDIISFISSNSDTYGETITHMIREPEIKNGVLVGYVTYGTNTGTNDENPVSLEFILGKYVGQINGLGHFLAFMKTIPGYIVCILVPFLLLIIYNGVNCIRLFKKYKKEQNAELENEKAQIIAEREQTAEMLKELQALKAELEAQKQKEKKDEDSSSEVASEQSSETTTEQE